MLAVGHRGCALVEPENTLRGFRRAIAMGCDLVETDVRLTRDGVLVLMHDETVDRTTNGSGRVAEQSFDEIRALDAGQGERVPTLVELLPLISERCQLLCELKGPGVEAEAVRQVKEAGQERFVIFTCFHFERLQRIKELDPTLRTGAIFADPPPDFAETARSLGAEGVGVHHRRQSRALIETAHAAGLQIRAWNPDTAEEIRAMIDLQPDGISSNRPDVLLHLLGRGPAPAVS
ncbi:MAG: glycerophosphodiester phosphodiesterase [Armatimonadetes bacterium]|nr:glycerophosphodiester phosphodiesterase [Armatimonadota bacterium]